MHINSVAMEDLSLEIPSPTPWASLLTETQLFYPCCSLMAGCSDGFQVGWFQPGKLEIKSC